MLSTLKVSLSDHRLLWVGLCNCMITEVSGNKNSMLLFAILSILAVFYKLLLSNNIRVGQFHSKKIGFAILQDDFS